MLPNRLSYTLLKPTKAKTKTDIVLVCLGILLIASRYLFRSQYLYEWDSVQFALSIGKFDILWHQPHPPGYIWYVAVIKAAYQVVGDGNLAIISTNIIFSLFTLTFLYQAGKTILGDEGQALMAALLLAAEPIFWFAGSTATIYTVDSFISILMGYLLYKALKSPDLNILLASSVIFGFLGGFRQSALPLLAPLWLYVLLKKKRSLSDVILNLLLVLTAVLCWFIPTILNTGGLQNYLSISSGLEGGGNEKALIWFGGQSRYLLNNAMNYAVWFMEGVSPIGLGILIFALSKAARRLTRPIWESEKLQFFLVWIIPSLLFYLFYIEKPGYLLIIMPPIMLSLIWSVEYLARDLRSKATAVSFSSITYATMIGLFVSWFVWPCSEAGVPQKIRLPGFVIQPALSNYNWDVSARAIRQNDYVMNYFESYLKQNDDSETNTALFWAGGFPTWRHMMYYLPGYRSYWLVDASVSGMPSFHDEIYTARNGRTTSFSGKPFWMVGVRPDSIRLTLDRDIKTIIFIANRRTTIYMGLIQYSGAAQQIDLANGQSMFVLTAPFQGLDLGNIAIGY